MGDTFAVDNEDSDAKGLLSLASSVDLLRNMGDRCDEDNGTVELELLSPILSI